MLRILTGLRGICSTKASGYGISGPCHGIEGHQCDNSWGGL